MPRDAPQAPLTPHSELPRATAADAARSGASTGFATTNDTEDAGSPGRFSLASARHTVLQPGRASRGDAFSSPHAMSAASRHSVQEHAYTWCNDDPFSLDGTNRYDVDAHGVHSVRTIQHAAGGNTPRIVPRLHARLAAAAAAQQPGRADVCVQTEQVCNVRRGVQQVTSERLRSLCSPYLAHCPVHPARG